MPLPEVLEGKPYTPWPPGPAGTHFVVRCESGSSAEMEVVGSQGHGYTIKCCEQGCPNPEFGTKFTSAQYNAIKHVKSQHKHLHGAPKTGIAGMFGVPLIMPS